MDMLELTIILPKMVTLKLKRVCFIKIVLLVTVGSFGRLTFSCRLKSDFLIYMLILYLYLMVKVSNITINNILKKIQTSHLRLEFSMIIGFTRKKR